MRLNEINIENYSLLFIFLLYSIVGVLCFHFHFYKSYKKKNNQKEYIFIIILLLFFTFINSKNNNFYIDYL